MLIFPLGIFTLQYRILKAFLLPVPLITPRVAMVSQASIAMTSETRTTLKHKIVCQDSAVFFFCLFFFLLVLQCLHPAALKTLWIIGHDPWLCQFSESTIQDHRRLKDENLVHLLQGREIRKMWERHDKEQSWSISHGPQEHILNCWWGSVRASHLLHCDSKSHSRLHCRHLSLRHLINTGFCLWCTLMHHFSLNFWRS